MEEYLVYRVTFVAENVFRYLDTCITELTDTLSGNERIWICRADENLLYTVSYDGFGTWRLFTVVAAGFEGDIHISAGAVDTAAVAVSEGGPFGVELAVTFMPALTDDLSVTDDDGSDHRVG